MPKAKPTAKKIEKKTEKKEQSPLDTTEKIIEIDTEVKDDDLELIPGEISEDDPEDDEAGLDEEEIDPFKDKWEE